MFCCNFPMNFVRNSISRNNHPSCEQKRLIKQNVAVQSTKSRVIHIDDDDDDFVAKKAIAFDACDEDLPETQVLTPPPSEDEQQGGEESVESDSDDDETDFRSHCSEVMKEHGLEVARSWFQLEARHFKKPKIEKKQKQL